MTENTPWWVICGINVDLVIEAHYPTHSTETSVQHTNPTSKLMCTTQLTNPSLCWSTGQHGLVQMTTETRRVLGLEVVFNRCEVRSYRVMHGLSCPDLCFSVALVPSLYRLNTRWQTCTGTHQACGHIETHLSSSQCDATIDCMLESTTNIT